MRGYSFEDIINNITIHTNNMQDAVKNIAILKDKCVGDLQGRFYIPDYQRGYRWGRQNVRQLLEDIVKNQQAHYYLQPIVVCEHENEAGEEHFDYDVIDGQQRLTTLLIIYKVLNKICQKAKDAGFNILDESKIAINFSISYQTRQDSEAFLNGIEGKTLEEAASFADYLYMFHAYQEADSWFAAHQKYIPMVAEALASNVFLIWYQVVADKEEARAVFERLNIGKIKLTNAELVKALFLSASSKMDEEAKKTVGKQWDEIERELHDPMFWSFLTNNVSEAYPTRIELLLDMLANKSRNERDEYITFLYFDHLFESQDIDKQQFWNDELYLEFLKLKDWYNEREYYHKIGFLVTVGETNSLQGICKEYRDKQMTHSGFKRYLDKEIRKTMDFVSIHGTEDDLVSINDLSYGSNNSFILKLLTLFNVMTMQQIPDETQRYPFYLHKKVHGGWSLEHIHAQKSETLNKVEQWREWTGLHLASLRRYRKLQELSILERDEATAAETSRGKSTLNDIDRLALQMEDFLNTKEPKGYMFEDIANQYSNVVVDKDASKEYKDSIGNITLLRKDDNAMLSNSTFDVKRELVTKKVMARSYVPICTQRVFLKSYTPAEKNQMFFWGQDDREAYIREIKKVLHDYLPSLSEVVYKLFAGIENMNPDILERLHPATDKQREALDQKLTEIAISNTPGDYEGSALTDDLALHFYTNIVDMLGRNHEKIEARLKELLP